MQFRIKFYWSKQQPCTDRRGFTLNQVVTVVKTKTSRYHRQTLWINGRSLLWRAVAVALAGYLAAAAGLFFWLDRNPCNRVGFTDLLFPWHWAGLRDLRGQTYIAEGLENLQAQRFGEAVFKLKLGLARHPYDPSARMALAKFYAKFDYYQGIREVMLPGLALSHPPREFVRFFLESATHSDDCATIIEICNRVLAHPGLPVAEQCWLLEQKAGALIVLQRYREALEVLADPRLRVSSSVLNLRVGALCGAGRAKEAVEMVRSWQPTQAFREYRLKMLAYADGEAGKPEDMAKTLNEVIALHPADPGVRIFAITRYVATGWKDAAARELHVYLQRFEANPDNVLQVAQQCADAGAAELVGLCLEDVRELGQPTRQLELMLAISQVVSGDVPGAQRTYETLIKSWRQPVSINHPQAQPEAVIYEWLGALLDTMASEAPGLAEHFAGVLQRSRYTLWIYIDSIKALAKAGRWGEVNAVATAGLMAFPGSSEMTRWRETAAGKIASLPRPAAAPVSPRIAAAPVRVARPVAPATQEPGPAAVDFRTIGMEKFLAKLDQAMQRGAWPEADGLIREARRASPSWLVRVEGELAWREIRSAMAQGDTLRLGYLISQRLKEQKTEASRALGLAREYREKDDLKTARLIAEKIAEAVPEFKPGRVFLAELKQAEHRGSPGAVPTDAPQMPAGPIDGKPGPGKR